MIKQRILQLVAIALYCVVIVGCQPNKVEQAEEAPLDSTETIVSQTDSLETSSIIADSTQTRTITDSSKTESTDKTISPDDSSKDAEAVAKDENKPDATIGNKDKINESEIYDSASQFDTTTTVDVNTDSAAIDKAVVDSLWNRLLVDVKILNDTTFNQADSESVNRDSLLEVVKKQKLDSLLIGVIHPINTSTGSPGGGGWPWWLTVLAGVVGLLFGALLTWLISKFTRKKDSSSSDEKEIKPKLIVKELSDLDDEKDKKLIDFYKRMIIK